MLSVFIGGISYPVVIEVESDTSGDPLRESRHETIKTSADCPRCTERPTQWEHEVTYNDFNERKPGALVCGNCDHSAPLLEVS